MKSKKSRLTELNLALNLQVDDLRKTLSKLQHSLEGLTAENKSKTAELKKIEEKYNSLVYDKTSIFDKNEELNRDLLSKNENINKLTIEKEEFALNFKKIEEEYAKLSRAYEYLTSDYQNLSLKLASTKEINENLLSQQELHSQKLKITENELQTAIRIAETSDYKKSEAEKSLEILLKDIKSSKIRSQELDDDRDELFRKLNSVESEKSFFETRFRAAENELSSLKSQLEYEKQKSFESKTFKEKDGFRRLEIEEERLRTFKNSNSDLVSELYRQIEAYKTDSLKLEVEYMKTVDELAKVKGLLYQAEKRVVDLENARR